ncbi:MAG: SRPBCC domain-containing protein [Anaerolineae bacterium]|nr:SRPBCC domain-containing protein [Anaerolineae bacterium]
MQREIHIERYYRQPPERVWDALTDPTHLAAWYMPNNFRAEVGHTFTFRTDPAPGFDGLLHCEVVVVERPHKLAYTFRGGWMDRSTLVTWTLLPQDGGTLLRLEHTGFTALSDPAIRTILESGWGTFLPRLDALMAAEQA